MVKVTAAAMSQIKKEVQDLLDEGKQPFVRLAMGIG
ncbi:hypothetical protein JOC85_000950 [Bacillus mesophilus]|nr:hypothetical protein [Bacillus mesophilus]